MSSRTGTPQGQAEQTDLPGLPFQLGHSFTVRRHFPSPPCTTVNLLSVFSTIKLPERVSCTYKQNCRVLKFISMITGNLVSHLPVHLLQGDDMNS